MRNNQHFSKNNLSSIAVDSKYPNVIEISYQSFCRNHQENNHEKNFDCNLMKSEFFIFDIFSCSNQKYQVCIPNKKKKSSQKLYKLE